MTFIIPSDLQQPEHHIYIAVVQSNNVQELLWLLYGQFGNYDYKIHPVLGYDFLCSNINKHTALRNKHLLSYLDPVHALQSDIDKMDIPFGIIHTPCLEQKGIEQCPINNEQKKRMRSILEYCNCTCFH